MLYNACNESCLIYLNSHKQLERDASEGYTNKLNKCDEDIDQTTLEKKEIEKISLKITPRSVEMEQMINKSTSTLKKINDNIMVKELEAEADTLSNKIKECLTEYEHFNVKDNHRKILLCNEYYLEDHSVLRYNHLFEWYLSVLLHPFLL